MSVHYIPSDNDRPYRGKRISWAEFTIITGLPKPDYAARAANDNATPDALAA
ncbi:hypothetical protein NBH19_25470 [Rhizobium sp. S95]|uniref:Uncharacterized protein n=1 Tax=Ciceribacter sichuanensis TaxID=2949647 RepID=A0AAJ1FA04_9HYPH|nr:MULTISPECIES: hypothetical protein [unclassified Ciceribacter]MCM2399440.1 hypothetical protein [Ciceribacter sp. S95]MCO5959768.1 hypothetical protein [Ciceribacter sp. S101]